MADFNNTNLADFSGVWVFCEQRQGELQPTVLELISEARKLADDMGTEVCGLLLGGKGVGEKMAKELGAYGADKVLVLRERPARDLHHRCIRKGSVRHRYG